MKPVNRQAAAGMSYAPSQNWQPDRIPRSDHVLTKEARTRIREKERDAKEKRKLVNKKRSERRKERTAGDHRTFLSHALPLVANVEDGSTLRFEPIADRLNDDGHRRTNGMPWDGKTILRMLRRHRPELFGLSRGKAPRI
jgi:hypothetical protein